MKRIAYPDGAALWELARRKTEPGAAECYPNAADRIHQRQCGVRCLSFGGSGCALAIVSGDF